MKGCLSKSQYTSYVQCPKLFWLSRKKKEKLTPPSVQQQQIFKTGSMVGDVAQQLFPGGEEIPFDIKNIPGMVEQTRQMIEKGQPIIYEASFLYDEIFVAVDILVFKDGLYYLYEVKSSTECKDHYIDDASIQAYTLNHLGYSQGSVNVVHLNKTYQRGDELDIPSLFTIVDVTEEVSRKQQNISSRIVHMKQLLNQPEPEVSIARHCLKPYECSAKNYCWKELAGIPDQSVFNLYRANKDKLFELYHQGIVDIKDVPLEKRSPIQTLQIKGEVFVDQNQIREFLSSLKYPISHLDFETFQQAVPEFPGISPFQQIPFQYSLHIEREENIEHKEYLAPVGVDPRRLLAEKLIEDIPNTGTILAYNKQFEVAVIRKLAGFFPDLQNPLKSIAKRIRDLLDPFQKGWYYHPEMNGSFSIKTVLPILVPEMAKAYQQLPVVHNGGEAMSIWNDLASEEDASEVERIRRGLLEYCKLDTLGMVEILKVLRTFFKFYPFYKVPNDLLGVLMEINFRNAASLMGEPYEPSLLGDFKEKIERRLNKTKAILDIGGMEFPLSLIYECIKGSNKSLHELKQFRDIETNKIYKDTLHSIIELGEEYVKILMPLV